MLPLLQGSEGFPVLAVAPGTPVGQLIVSGAAREREGLTVQRCLCGCNRSSCGVEADVDVRYLHDPEKFSDESCPFEGEAFFPDFEELRSALRRHGIESAEQYRQSYVRGYLPRGTPLDPAAYKEWTCWAELLGKEDCRSNREIFDGMLALDLDSLGLLPRPERRRVLLLSRHWAGIRGKAAELKIPEEAIPDRLHEILSALHDGAPDRIASIQTAEASPNISPGGRPGSAGGVSPQPLTLAEHAQTLVNLVTIWMPSGAEIQREILNGFFHSVWELLDREDTLAGNGHTAVAAAVLGPLSTSKPELVAEFSRQYEEVSRLKTAGRNWMQAYSLWYAQTHRRFINWSAAGLGKTRTVPALVSAHDIHLTLLFSPKAISNEHNPQLAAELAVEDPLARLHYSDAGIPVSLTAGRHHYIVVNPEKLQQDAKSCAMIDAMLRLAPGLIVFDEGHLLVSSNLVNQETGETETDARHTPRMRGLRYLLDQYGAQGSIPGDVTGRGAGRVVVLTGTPVRTDSREGQALFELIGEDIGEFSSEMSEVNALRLRGKLQEFGFHFSNHALPQLRRFIVPFMVDNETAGRLNSPNLSMATKEKLRIEQALARVWTLRGQAVINAEGVALDPREADALDNAMPPELNALDRERFPVVRLLYEPMEKAIHPVFFSVFVDGPVEAIAACLTARNLPFRICTGESDKSELGAYLTGRDSCLIASSSWSVGVDGSQKISDTLVTLGVPWHDSGHRQMVARLHRQGAITLLGGPTRVIHEIIPVAINVGYDVKRLNRLYERRSFAEVLSAGQVQGANDREEFTSAVGLVASLAQ